MSNGQQVLSVTDNFLSDQVPVCNICGDSHETEYCSVLHDAKPVPDTQTVSRARLTLPSNLEVRSLADGSTTVVAKMRLERGTLFGPFQAQLSVDMHPGVCFPLKVFGKAAGEGYYLDTTDEEMCNWMCLVAPATTSREQNLICYDMKESIYYTCTRDVLPGEELRVWYALYYGFKLQALPLSDDSTGDGFWDLPEEGVEPKSELKNTDGLICGNELVQTLAQHLPAQTLGAKGDRETWKCQLCGIEERNVASYARHLMAHYRRPVPITEQMKCPLCNKLFHSVKALMRRECKHCGAQVPNSFLKEQTPEENESGDVYHHEGTVDCPNSTMSEAIQVINDANNMPENESLTSNLDEWKPSKSLQQQNHQRQVQRKKHQHQKRQRQRWQRKRAQWQYRRNQQKLKQNQLNHKHLNIGDDKSVNFISTADNMRCSKNELTTPNYENGSSTGKLMSLASISSVELQNISVGCESASYQMMEDKSLCGIQSDIRSDSTNVQVWNADTSEQVTEGCLGNLSLTLDNQQTLPEIVKTESDCRDGGGGISFVVSDVQPKTQSDCGDGGGGTCFVVSDVEPTDALSGSAILDDTSVTCRTGKIENNIDENIESPHFTIDDRTQFYLQTEDGVIPTTFRLDGSQSIDVALDGTEPVTFIIVNSTGDMNDIDVKKLESDDKGLKAAGENESASPIVKRMDEKSFQCDICNKVFVKSEYLYRHLRKHTGEFTCMSCLAVFARKENLKSHSCTRSVVRYPCPSCGKKFSSKKYLQRHMPLHTGEYMCRDCNKSFASRMSLSVHRCTAGQSGTTVSCDLCKRIFSNQAKLQTHLKKHHSDVNTDGMRLRTAATRKAKKCPQTNPDDVNLGENTVPHDNEFVCEVCGAIFKSASSMKTHSFIHGERRFQCEVCKKRFHRKDVLQDHLTVHQSAKLPCHICGKKYKTRKSLEVHMLTHGGAKRFSCEECGKNFFQKGNLQKHLLTHAADRVYPCLHCSKTFTSKEYYSVHVLEHTQGKIFSCETCNKSFVKKHLLESHRQLYHSNRAYLCKFCNSLMRHRHSTRRHLEQRHDDHRHEWSEGGFIEKMLAELPDSSLLTPNEGPLTPSQQQKRQQTLLALRRQHYGDNSLLSTVCAVVEEFDKTVDYLYTVLPNSDPQPDENQDHPPTEGQPVQQLALLENLLLDTSVQVPSITTGEMQGGEVLLTVVGSHAFSDSNASHQEATIFSGNEISAEDGNTYVMGSDGENSGVLLYVLEASEAQDIWDSNVDLSSHCSDK